MFISVCEDEIGENVVDEGVSNVCENARELAVEGGTDPK